MHMVIGVFERIQNMNNYAKAKSNELVIYLQAYSYIISTFLKFILFIISTCPPFEIFVLFYLSWDLVTYFKENVMQLNVVIVMFNKSCNFLYRKD